MGFFSQEASLKDCDALFPGVGLAVIGLLLWFCAAAERRKSKLSASLPLSACGLVSTGLVHVAGRAAGELRVTSALLGAPCLISQIKLEAYVQGEKGKVWEKVYEDEQRVPFFVEDGTGRVRVESSSAELNLVPDMEYSTEKPGKLSAQQQDRLQEAGLSADELERRLRSLYELHLCERYGVLMPEELARKIARLTGGGDPSAAMKMALGSEAISRGKEQLAEAAAEEARKTPLRFTETNLLPGTPVYVLGPAYEAPQGANWAYPVAIQKIHPADPFVIGEGTQSEVLARMKKSARNMTLLGAALAAVGFWMALSCF